MKRRLALLLAMSLTMASLSVTGVGAAEVGTEATVVEQVAETESVDENIQNEAQATTENEVEVVEENAETATEAVSTAETTEGTEAEENAAVTEEAVASATTGATAEVAAEVEPGTEETEEAATAATTETEAAAVAEPALTVGVPATATTEAEAATKTTEAAATAAAATVKQEEKAATSTRKGWYYENGNAYFYQNGVKLTGLKVCPYHGVMRTFFFNSSGVKQTGWKTIDNKGTVCYFADSRYSSMPPGAMVTGFRQIGGYWFYMADSTYANAHGVPRGKQITGWQTLYGKTYFFNDGSIGGWPVGAAVKNWKIINGYYYYFADAKVPSLHEGAMLTGWNTIGGRKFYFADYRYKSQPRGTVVKGLAKIGNNYFMFGSTGVMTRGWTTYNGRMAYYDTTSGAAKFGWHAKGSSWYFTYTNGVAKTGWLEHGGSLFYLDPTNGGKMATGSVLMPSGRLFFFDEDGRRATTEGWKSVGGYMYYTYANGTCARNTTIDGVKLDSMGRSTMTAMDRKAQSYSSNTNYLILVNKDEYKVCVYKGSRNNWTKLKEWYCTHGGSNTPNGEWTIDDHVTKRSATYGWAVFDYSSAAFATHISAGNYFHSILYEKYIGQYYPNTNPYDEEPMDPDLKQNYSHGCVRLLTENAEWIWDNVPLGTKVVVY